MLLATCLSLPAILASAAGGEVISLKGACQTVRLSREYKQRVTVNAFGSKVKGLIVTGGNVRWVGGEIAAPQGAFAVGPSGYGVLIKGASNVILDNILITDANRGVVLERAKGVTIVGSRFLRLGSDGIIANASENIRILRNRFADTLGKPTQCVIRTAVLNGLKRRDCEALPGVWTDGFHPDAIQMRNGLKDVLISGNIVEGATQGISQMDTLGDAPLENVVIEFNTVTTDAPHKATLTTCYRCVIRQNKVSRPRGSKWKAVILPGPAERCGNLSEASEADC